MSIVSVIKECRICHNKVIDVISLGEQVITSRFPNYGDFSTPKTPIDLCRCVDCGLLQLKQTTYSNELYEYEYGYRSGISNTMREHLKQYQQDILSKLAVPLKTGDIVLDIGSNDSTLLQYYDETCRRVGIDPTGKQFSKYYGTVELIPTYFTRENYRNVIPEGNCKIVSSISMFYDLPDPVQFAKDIYEVLDDSGIWTCEQSYMPTMIQTNSIDTICHEHLEYYSLIPVKRIAQLAGFKIIDVQFNPCNGGSFRIYFAKSKCPLYTECVEQMDSIIHDELTLGVMTDNLYTTFFSQCKKEVDKLVEFIDIVNQDQKNVYIYGASTKGNCLLQFAGIGEDKIKYAVERNPDKIGKMTNTGIEIIGEETMRENPPNYLLVLPWHFREEIVKREEDFLKKGGQIIFPFPRFEIVSHTPKMLITGCDGMISQEVISQTRGTYTLYGMSRLTTSRNELTKMILDLNNSVLLERYIQLIRPDVIVHLASISSSAYALSHPLETLQSNGMIVAHLCDIIHRNRMDTKLFNASSSEIYKGHVDYLVKEDDPFTHHLHPYSIAKTMGHNILKFYRKTYHLPFSNGIIFTTESVNKRPEFLLNKIKNHAKQFHETKEPIVVGNLDSYRNILHASDVASAISIIVQQESGDDYLICNTHSVKVFDLVVKIYEKWGIVLTPSTQNNVFYDSMTNQCVLIVQDKNIGFDEQPTNIRGECVKLKNLGWTINYNIEDIV